MGLLLQRDFEFLLGWKSHPSDEDCPSVYWGVVDGERLGAKRLVDENKAQLSNVKGIIDNLKNISAKGLPEVGGQAA